VVVIARDRLDRDMKGCIDRIDRIDLLDRYGCAVL
jgi:hypothetical protein